MRTACDADADLFPHRPADGGQPRGVEGGVRPDLDLEAVVAAGDGVAGVPGHLLGRVDADGDVGDQLPPGAAQQLVHRDAVQLAVEVPQGHVGGGFGACVVDAGFLDPGGDGFKVVHLLPDEGGGDQLDQAAHNAAGGVPGDGAGGGRFAVAHRAGVGVQLDHDVLDPLYRPQGRLERHPQRHRQLA